MQHLGIHHPGSKFGISVFLSQSLPVPVAHQNNNHVICPSLHTSQICLQWEIVNHKLDWFPIIMIIWLSLVLKNKWTTNDKREMGTVLEPFFFLSLCAFAVTVSVTGRPKGLCGVFVSVIQNQIGSRQVLCSMTFWNQTLFDGRSLQAKVFKIGLRLQGQGHSSKQRFKF